MKNTIFVDIIKIQFSKIQLSMLKFRGLKNLFFTIIFICTVGFTSKAQVAINSSGNPANGSAMLDVTSTTKGLLPPRMTTAQRLAIVSPAIGLVVYDTNTLNYYYYDSTGWSELINKDGTGKTIIGTTVDNTTFETDGTMIYNGTATVWDDMQVSPGAATKNLNPPDWGAFIDGLQLFVFDPVKEEQVYFSVQIPHGYKVGSDLHPHVHWTTPLGIPSANNVVWGLEYTIVNIGGQFPNSVTLSANNVIPGIGTPTVVRQHLITAFATIPGAALNISSILVCRLFRNATNVADTFPNDVGLLSFDLHYEKDADGSHTDFIK